MATNRPALATPKWRRSAPRFRQVSRPTKEKGSAKTEVNWVAVAAVMELAAASLVVGSVRAVAAVEICDRAIRIASHRGEPFLIDIIRLTLLRPHSTGLWKFSAENPGASQI